MRDIYYPTPKKKKKSLNLTGLSKYLIGLLVVVVIAYFGLRLANAQINRWLELEPINVDEVEESGITSDQEDSKDNKDSTDNSGEDKVEATIDDTLKSDVDGEVKSDSENNPEPADIDKGSISMRVLNGNGKPGSAAEVRNLLEGDGFKVFSIGNANNQSYQSTVVYYNKDKSAQAEMVQTLLKENDYQVSTSENASLAGNNDLLIVIGQK